MIRVPELDGVAPVDAAEALRDLPGLALLESARPGRTGRWSYLTADPLALVEAPATGPDPFREARALLARLDRRQPPPDDRAQPAHAPFSGGLVGYLGYDLGRRLEHVPSIAVADQDLPELRLALHDWTLAWDRQLGNAWLAGRAVDGDGTALARRLLDVLDRVRARGGAAAPDRAGAQDQAAAPDQAGAPGRAGAEPARPVLELRSRTSHGDWVRQVSVIRDSIAAGSIYQANLTRRLEAPFDGDPWSLFRRLRVGDPALFAGFLDLGRSPMTGAMRAVLSASPEPFLAIDGERIVSADPIKGTRPRGDTLEADRALLRQLLASAKDQAENVMIVDVLRNDLGRVCEPGSVRVPRLLRPERTAAVQHLVTTVTGRLRADRDAFDLLAASFPGGSITGAPKIRAMQVIESLEPVRRGPYCGTMLWMGPDRRMGSSILIRTLVADGERLTLHVGGGITWRSDAEAEWQETMAKAGGPLRAIGAVEVVE
jgi:para-aminobenzoate synthetase component 1